MDRRQFLALSLLTAAGCKKKPESSGQSSRQTTNSILRNTSRIQDLQKKADICDRLAEEYDSIALRADSTFANSARQTARSLRTLSNQFTGKDGSLGFMYTPTLGIEAGLADPITHVVPDIFSVERFQGLDQALRSYGFEESANLWQEDRSQLIWRKKLDSIESAYLITSGNYQGFFVRENGDLIVPGLQFYRNSPDASRYTQIRNHFRNEMPKATSLLESKDYQAAAKIFLTLVEEDKMPDKVLFACYHNAGFAFYHMSAQPNPNGSLTVYPDKV
jgi:hypothetical protein